MPGSTVVAIPAQARLSYPGLSTQSSEAAAAANAAHRQVSSSTAAVLHMGQDRWESFMLAFTFVTAHIYC